MASSTTAFDLVAMAARLDAVINSARDGIIIADAELRILLLNPAAERMFGCTGADTVGESAERLLPGLRDGSEPPAAPLGVIALSGTRADGSQFPLEASVAESAAGFDAFTPHDLQSPGICSRCPYLASTAAADLAPQPARPG